MMTTQYLLLIFLAERDLEPIEQVHALDYCSFDAPVLNTTMKRVFGCSRDRVGHMTNVTEYNIIVYHKGKPVFQKKFEDGYDYNAKNVVSRLANTVQAFYSDQFKRVYIRESNWSVEVVLNDVVKIEF